MLLASYSFLLGPIEDVTLQIQASEDIEHRHEQVRVKTLHLLYLTLQYLCNRIRLNAFV